MGGGNTPAWFTNLLKQTTMSLWTKVGLLYTNLQMYHNHQLKESAMLTMSTSLKKDM